MYRTNTLVKGRSYGYGDSIGYDNSYENSYGYGGSNSFDNSYGYAGSNGYDNIYDISYGNSYGNGYSNGYDNGFSNRTPSTLHQNKDKDKTDSQCEHLNKDKTKSDMLYERYINKISREQLYYLFKRNGDFVEDLVKCIRDKLAQSNEQILDKRYNYITLNIRGYAYLDESFLKLKITPKI